MNDSRFKKMRVRFEAMEKIKDIAHEKLLKVVQDQKKYRAVLKQMILQGLIKLMEESVTIRVRKEDIPHIEAIKDEAEAEFNELVKKQTGLKFDTKLIINHKIFLQPEDCK